MKDKVIGIVITDGVGYRNFVLSPFFNELTVKYNVIVIYSGLPKNVYSENLKTFKNIIIRELKVFSESKTTWFYRKLKEVAHMYLHRDFYGIIDTLERGYPKENTKRGLIVKAIYAIAKFFHSEKNIQYYEKRQFNTFRKNPITISYANFLDEDQPDLLFFTHQRPPYLAPFLAMAKKNKIETTSFIFSWDNLASKGRMLGSFDGHFVWSKLMKDELLHFYPTVVEKNIKIIGAPQFEHYTMEKYKISKNEFFTKFNLDFEKKIICYSCADASIGKNDDIYIRAIVNFIEKSEKLQLLVRTSPAEDGKRFSNLIIFYSGKIIVSLLVSQIKKLLLKFKSMPKDLSWLELVKILKYYGYSEIMSGKTSGSRRKFKNDAGAIITLHKPHPSLLVKTYVIKQLIAHLK